MSDRRRNVKTMIIECELCDTSPEVDHDCMVAFLTDRARDSSPVRMDADQAAAVEFMVKGGLIAPLRLVPPLPQTPPRRTQLASVEPISRVS